MTSKPKLYQGKPIASICRLCFMERKRLVPIFKGNSGRFSKWIEKLTSLKILNHPNAPTSLCTGCNSALEAFDAFRKMCITNDRAFRKAFDSDCTQAEEVTASEIKVEYDEDREAVRNETPDELQRNNGQDQLPETSKIKIEYNDDLQTVIADERDENASTNNEVLRGREETEVEPTELLIDVGETKIEVQDIADETVEGNAMGIRLPEIATNDIFGSNPVEGTQVDSLEIDSSSESIESAEQEAIESSEPNMTEASDLISLRNKAEGNRYQCKTCNRRTSKLHALTHKDRDAFQCYVCAKWFRMLTSLYRHIDKLHEGSMISGVDYHEGGPVSDDRQEDQIMEIVFAKGGKRRARREKSRAFAIDEVVASEGHSQGPLPVLRSEDVKVVSEDDMFGNVRFKDLNHLKSQCRVCRKITSMLHTRSHKAEKLFQCFICEEKFKFFNDLKHHIDYWHRNGDKRLLILSKAEKKKDHISVERDAIAPMNGVELNEQDGSDNAPPELQIDVYETKVEAEDAGSEYGVEEVTDKSENDLNNDAKEMTCQLENYDSEIVESNDDDNEIVMSNQEPEEDEDLTDGDGETVLVVVVQEDLDASEVEDSKGRGKSHQTHASAAPETVEEDYEMKNEDEVIQIDSSDEGDD